MKPKQLDFKGKSKRTLPRAIRKGEPVGPPYLAPCSYCQGLGKIWVQEFKRTKKKKDST